MDTVLNILSFALALYALYQSKTAKQIAKEVETKFKHNRQTSGLSKLVARLDIIINEVKVFGPAASLDKLQGLDKQKVAESVQDFALFLKESVEVLSSLEQKNADHTYNTLMNLLPTFSDSSKTLAETKDCGSRILSELSTLNSKFKSSLNKKIEKTD